MVEKIILLIGSILVFALVNFNISRQSNNEQKSSAFTYYYFIDKDTNICYSSWSGNQFMTDATFTYVPCTPEVLKKVYGK